MSGCKLLFSEEKTTFCNAQDAKSVTLLKCVCELEEISTAENQKVTFFKLKC